MGDLILVKWGGSLITDKTKKDTARLRTITRLAGELARERANGHRFLLGHGGGSFGHQAAVSCGLNQGPIRKDAREGAARTQERAAALHQIVRRALLDKGLPAFSFAPSSFFVARAGRPSSVALAPLREALTEDWLPVVYGDVVQDRVWGACVCSTETVLIQCAERLLRAGTRIRRVVWLGETDGVYDPDGKTIPRIGFDAIGERMRQLQGASGPDVTGGIRHRLEAAKRLAKQGIVSVITDGRRRGALKDALSRRPERGTRIAPRTGKVS